MKRTLPLFASLLALALLALLAGVAHASETASELPQVQAATAAPAPVADAAMEAVLAEQGPASLEFPVQPDFTTAGSEGGTCTPCSNHGQCFIACAGGGACFRDLGLHCGDSTSDKYCFCG